MKVLIVAGGTGGHVIPGLTVAEQLRAQGHGVHWLGTQAGIEASLVPKKNIPIDYLVFSAVRGKGLLGWIKMPFRLLRAVLQARKILAVIQPSCILGMGGYVSAPVGLAAWLKGIPLIIHEQNAVLGLSNRLLAKLAKMVLFAYPNVVHQIATHRTAIVGNPIRATLEMLPEPVCRINKEKALKILVIGGSRGAHVLNQVISFTLNELQADAAQCPIKVWHQTGNQDYLPIQQYYQTNGLQVEVSAFIEDMAHAYQWADLVIARAGALTLAEITAVGTASILVPYPHAVDDHQTQNAKLLVEAQAAILIPQVQFTSELLKSFILSFAQDRRSLLFMAESAKKLHEPNSTQKISDILQKTIMPEVSL